MNYPDPPWIGKAPENPRCQTCDERINDNNHPCLNRCDICGEELNTKDCQCPPTDE